MKPKYFVDRGNYKEIIRNDKSKFKCPFCGRWYNGLAYHTVQAHKITGRELRRLMGLTAHYQLVTPRIRARHQEIVNDNSDSHIKNNLLKKGLDTRYKEGYEGHLKHNWSNQAIKEMSIRRTK